MGTRTKILVRGIVQGVGFRPYVYTLARRGGLRGRVLNNETGVVIDLEGDNDAIDRFVTELEKIPPALSSIESVLREDNLDARRPFDDFVIEASTANGHARLSIAPDTAVCDECVAELSDPDDRRYRYPFINCTNCGPRFTIIESVPYDRDRTTMREFEMCTACRTEYEDPLDRRFHAEPVACDECGPRLRLTDSGGADDNAGDIIRRAIELYDRGKIVAVKGLGGYHLSCDAANAAAVRNLRTRKFREDKPFAMMARSIGVIERYCEVSAAESDLLTSRERPIVLLAKKESVSLPAEIAPGVSTFGFMLPYTPLHHLLLNGRDEPLVMTSGNMSDEPIAYKDADAAERLNPIADYFLTNDRRINIRTDDSIVRTPKSAIRNPRSAIVLRRSRGYAPVPVTTSVRFDRQILACGAELKNTFCIARDNSAFLSHHIGDLENLETLLSFTEGIEHFRDLFDLEPDVIAYDLHPEYLSTKYARAHEGFETKIGIQHHHAHIASCLADNDADGEVIGVAMDGLGFGTDGKLWGGEFFVADFLNTERVGHLDYVPMPGGAKAVTEPWRMAAVYLQRTFGDAFVDLDLPFNRDLDRAGWKTLRSMIERRTNCPETSSMGRLFDAVSALLGLRSSVNYEGQAAIALEHAACGRLGDGYAFDVDVDGTIRTGPVIRKLVEDLLNGEQVQTISARFHLAVADLIATIAVDVRDTRNLDRVALSGGVFQNMLLLQAASTRLAEAGFTVLTHSRVPTNDGGISLGQAVVANAQIRSGRI
jgi:hydrogenase maturation protein HypF